VSHALIGGLITNTFESEFSSHASITAAATSGRQACDRDDSKAHPAVQRRAAKSVLHHHH
jgi:hypothetical protein